MSNAMRNLALLVVLLGCKSKPAEHKPAETAKLPAQPGPAPALPAQPAPADNDGGFKTAMQSLAESHQWVVSGWGTARLAGSASDRWAQLVPDPTKGAANGAYLVQSGDTYYLVEFPSDSKTSPWMGVAPNATWRTNAGGGFIEHTQGDAAESTRYQLAIRGGDVVVLRMTQKTRNEPEKQTVYANLAGECKKPCPKAEAPFTVKTSKTLDF
jgi:hypothetical protein